MFSIHSNCKKKYSWCLKVKTEFKNSSSNVNIAAQSIFITTTFNVLFSIFLKHVHVKQHPSFKRFLCPGRIPETFVWKFRHFRSLFVLIFRHNLAVNFVFHLVNVNNNVNVFWGVLFIWNIINIAQVAFLLGKILPLKVEKKRLICHINYVILRQTPLILQTLPL